jgi:outer membrane protein OmpA-like peptidoglycan-associated protein
VNIRSRSHLGLAAAGILSCAACTADKTSIKPPEVASAPAVKEETKVAPSPRLAVVPPVVSDGVFAADERLASVYFDLNRSRLNDGALDVVKKNAEWLKSQPPFLIRVVGYADARGSARKNERLAAHRALRVREAYASMGIPEDRIFIDGRVMPVSECPGLTEECLSQSRRADTLIEEKSLAGRPSGESRNPEAL